VGSEMCIKETEVEIPMIHCDDLGIVY
jgi:hypothetical protein